MLVDILRVEQRIARPLQPLHQMHQRHLACILGMGKHTLAEERATQRNAVKPARKLLPRPAFNAVRKTAARNLRVKRDDVVVDPGLAALGTSRIGAGADDLLEGRIYFHLVGAVA